MKPHPTAGWFEIRQRLTDGHKALHARRSFEPGETLVRFSPRALLPEPAVHTIQIGASDHILLDPEFLEYTNHGCSPNVIFDVRRMRVKAVEPIRAGDEILYFYPSTEVSMRQPFHCFCGSEQCLGLIKGAAHLPAEVLERYYLADHIRTHHETLRHSAPLRRTWAANLGLHPLPDS